MYNKLKPHVKEAWLKALRSGRYKQGLGALKTRVYGHGSNNKFEYCCLGVLCNLGDYAKKRWKQSNIDECFKYGGIDDGFPPDDVLEASGLSKKDMRKLAEMNDNNSSFAEIADYIEENL